MKYKKNYMRQAAARKASLRITVFEGSRGELQRNSK